MRTRLSEQEKEVLLRLKEGLKNKDVALSLGIHPKTIAQYILRIRQKLEIGQDANLYLMVQTAIDKGIIK